MNIIKTLIPGILLSTLIGWAQDQSPSQEVIQAVAPVYPWHADVGKASGSVKIEVAVSNTGAVIDMKGIDNTSVYYRIFGQASERAAQRWKFKANSDESINRKYILTFTFKIMPKNSPIDDITTIYHAPFEIEVRCAMRGTITFDPPNTIIDTR